MNAGDYNMLTDLLVVGIPTLAVAAWVACYELARWIDKKHIEKELN